MKKKKYRNYQYIKKFSDIFLLSFHFCTLFFRLNTGFLLIGVAAGCSTSLHLPSQDPSPSQLSLIQSATDSLPKSLKLLIQQDYQYKIINSGKILNNKYSDSFIVLSSNMVTEKKLKNNELERQILIQFFLSQYNKAPVEIKNKIQEFFRGNYAMALSCKKESSDMAKFKNNFARHAADYFIDPVYRCKHPMIARLLESAFYHHSPPSRECNKHVPFLISELGIKNKIQWIDPSRTYAIHLVFAGKTGNSISRFGHVALRLIQCNKKRRHVDKKCEEDIFDHITLGFKANVADIDISTWKGITGGYSIKLYAQNFIDTYSEYTIDNFRDLYSLPLKLTKKEIIFFVRGLSEVHWSYENEYRFFSQNCATELEWMINNALEIGPDKNNAKFFTKQRYRPDLLYRDATKSNRCKGNLLINLKQAETNGYFFPSAEKYYQLAIKTVKDSPSLKGQITASSLEEWANKTANYRLKHWLKPITSNCKLKNKRNIQAAAVIEAWIARKLRRRIYTELLTYYRIILKAVIDDKIFFHPKERKLILDCMDSIKTSNDTPGKCSEGIPLNNISIPLGGKCNIESPEFCNVINKIKDYFPLTQDHLDQIKEYNLVIENIKLLQAWMK